MSHHDKNPALWPSPDGAGGLKIDRSSKHPTQALTIATGGGDIDFTTNPLRWIHCGGAGNLLVQLAEDAGLVTYAVIAGTRFEGIIFKVGGASTASGLVGMR